MNICSAHITGQGECAVKIGSKRTTTALAYWSTAACSLRDFPRISAAALFALLTCAGATLFASEAFATTAAGRTPGSYAVSPTGAATYTIPIWAPAGPHGMQPHIALTYNSQQGNSYVGVGWGVSGLSSIYRCNLTIAQDGAAAPIALATSDGYCMDGQRLRLTSGTYGTASSTYQTEVANFINVTAYGTAGNGPSYWIAQDRNGRSYTYGDGGSSQVLANGSTTAVAWMANEVSDPYSNTMTIAYSTATGTAVPTTISWTPSSHGSSTYNYTMTFAYGANVVPPHGYVGGTSFTNPNLLSSIAIAYSGTAVKTYYLTYTASSTTGRDTLTQVQECAGTGTSNCLSPTTMTYQAGAEGVGSGTAVSGGVENVISTAFDFNGDGRNDLIGTNSAGALLVAFGTATGYGTPVSAPSGASRAFGDSDGSGVAGILVNVSGTWYYYKWNGSAFAGTSTGITVTTAASPILADVNGDGRADFVYTDSSGIVHVRLSTSTAGTVSFSSTDINTGVGISGFIISAQIGGSNRALHFWGAAQADLLGTERTCAQYNAKGICIAYQYIYYALHFTGSTFSTAGLFPAPLSSPNPAVDFADYNNDGCTDILTATALLLSACNGTAPVSVALPTGVTALGGMDWNGDGRRDVLVKQANGNLGVVLSTGSGLSSSVIGTSYSAASTSYTAAPNLTGDGQDALVAWNGTSVSYYLHGGTTGAPPDLLTKVTDGYGNSASPTYTTLALGSGTVYTEGTSGAYPDPNYVGPMYVVSLTTFSDPTSTNGGTYTQSATYASALENLLGRGFDGFNTLSITDSRNNLKDSSSFEQIFPYAGMKSQDTVTESSATVSVTTNAPYNPPWGNTLSSTPNQERYFPYFSGSTTQRYEVGGTENGDLITTASTNYTLDNYGNPTSVVTTVTDNDPNSPYTGQFWKTTVTNIADESTSPYCLSLFTQTQTAYTATNGAAVTITKTLTPDLTHCDYSQVVTQSNSGSAYAVTEALLYDAFGNVNSDTVTGTGMSARLTSTNWGTTGQFPASVTDPSGATTQFGYNFSYGKKSSQTDPNGLITSWQYTDGFGRKTQEARPDGTSTTWSYSDCNPGCLIGAHGTDITHTVYAVGGSTVITDGADYLDSVDRPLVSKARMLASGSYSRNEKRYDSLGRTAQVMMPCTWTALTTACPYFTTNSYDVLNRVLSSSRPISSTNNSLQSTNYAYAGRTTTVTDPYTVRYVVTDVNGWQRQTKDPMGYVVTLAYDAAGNKTSVTDSSSNPLWSGSYAYGISAFLTSMTDMDRGAWTYTPDALGERTAWTDAKGQSFSATYDALSRPLARKEPDLYTSWTWGSTPSAHNVGKLASVCTGTGTGPTTCTTNPGYAESETYDSLGRQSTRAITLPSLGTYTYTWAYNATTGLLSSLTFPTSTNNCQVVVGYGYANGLLSSVADASNQTNCGSTGTVYWTANATNPAGQVTEETLGNAIVTNRSFDAVTHWLGSVQSGVGGGAAAQNQSFLFDEMGNVIQRQDNNLGLTEGIWYDNDYRLSYSKLNGTQNLSVSYDATGDITARSDVAAGATWTYDPVKKHAVTEAGSSAFLYTYDSNGNAITRQGSSITWTSYNYPAVVNAGSGGTAETVSFLYGADRKRWQQAYSGNSTTETTNYIGGLLEQVVSGGVTDYRHYIYAGSEPVAIYHRNSAGSNAINYFLSDHEGSVASINSSSGTSEASESYTPFGLRRKPTTWSGSDSNADLAASAGYTRQGYTFQTQLGLWMGLNHMNGRVEDSMIGRFLSADPHIPDPTNTQSYNRYSYVNNNPLTQVDPTGFVNRYPVFSGPGGFIWGADVVDNQSGLTLNNMNGGGTPSFSSSAPSTGNNIDPTSGGNTGSTNASSLSGNGFGTGAAVNAVADQLTDSILGPDSPNNTGSSSPWQFVVGVGATVISPFFGAGLNFNMGLNIDGWNSSIYIQDQANLGVPNATGAFFGAGGSASIAQAAPPTTGFDSQNYAEVDIGRFGSVGVSATGNDAGGLDYSLTKGLKGGWGYGGGGFIGTTYTSTAVSPTAGSMWNATINAITSFVCAYLPCDN